jgi:hypothetical protein
MKTSNRAFACLVACLLQGASAGLLIGVAGTARAAVIVINNGLAPPNPANVIANNSFAGDLVSVQNVGCNVPVQEPCVEPGAGTSVTVVAGGAVGTQLSVYQTSSITMSGGVVGGNAIAGYSSLLTISGGSVEGSAFSRGISILTMSGGTLRGDLVASDSASIIFSGGTVSGFGVIGYDFSSIAMSGGSTGIVFVQDSSATTVSGGAAVQLRAGGSGSIAWTGGTISGDLVAYDSSQIVIFGSGFAVDGSPVGFGPITALDGTLTGTLLSGDPINSSFCHSGCTNPYGSGLASGVITLVPEPGTGLLVAAGLVGLAARRKRHAKAL